MTASPVQPLDFSGLHTYSVHDRHSKVSVADFAAPDNGNQFPHKIRIAQA